MAISTSGFWFNPACDIVHINTSMCLRSFKALVNSGFKFSRIALDIGEGQRYDDDEPHLSGCCGTFPPLKSYEPGRMNDRLARQLQILHGFKMTKIDGTRRVYPGCSDLKEVLIFMKNAGPLDHEIQRFDTYPEFKIYNEANPYFPLIGDKRVTKEEYTDHLMSSALIKIGENSWKGKKKPTITLARRSKPFPDGQEFRMFALQFPTAMEHRTIILGVRSRQIQSCMFTVYPPDWSGPGDYIVKLMGIPLQVGMTEAVVREEVENARKFFKTTVGFVEGRKVVLPKGKVGQCSSYSRNATEWRNMDDVF
jgi:hypothetical protein